MKTSHILAIAVGIGACHLNRPGWAGTDPEWAYTAPEAWLAANWNGGDLPGTNGTAIFGARTGGTQTVTWANDGEGLWMPDLDTLSVNSGADPVFGGQGVIGTSPTITTSFMDIGDDSSVVLSPFVWLQCDLLTGFSGSLTAHSAARHTVTGGLLLMDATLTYSGTSLFEQSDPDNGVFIGQLTGSTAESASMSFHTGATADIEGDVVLRGAAGDVAWLVVWGGDVDIAGNTSATSNAGTSVVHLSNGGALTTGSITVAGLESRGDYGSASIEVLDGGQLVVTGDVKLAHEQNSLGMLEVGTPSPFENQPQATIDGNLWVGWLGSGTANVYDEASLTVGHLQGGNNAGSSGSLNVHDTGSVEVIGDATIGTLTPMSVALDGGSLTVAGTSMFGFQSELTLSSNAVFETGDLILLDGANFLLEQGECTVYGALSTSVASVDIQSGSRLTLAGDSTVSAVLDIGATSPRGVTFARVEVLGADVVLTSAPMIGGHVPAELLISSNASVDVTSTDPIVLGDGGDIFITSGQLTCRGLDASQATDLPTIYLINSSTLQSEGAVVMPEGFIYNNGGAVEINDSLVLGYLTLVNSQISISDACTLGVPGESAVGLTLSQPQAGTLVEPMITAGVLTVQSDTTLSLNLPDPLSALGHRWPLMTATSGTLLFDPETDLDLPDFSAAGLQVSSVEIDGTLAIEFDAVIEGDCDLDLDVDHDDLLTMLDTFLSCALTDPNQVYCPTDINRDGEVNVRDLLILLENWSA